MRKKIILVLLNLCFFVPVLSHLLNVPQSQTVIAAGPEDVVVKPSLSVQAMTVAELYQRKFQPLGVSLLTFEHQVFNYQVQYPSDWQAQTKADYSITMQSADRQTQLRLSTIAEPTRDLADEVLHQVQNEIILARQSLTIDGYPAEQATTYADEIAGQRFYLFIHTGQAIHVLQGAGNRMMIETVAHSFETM